MWLNFVCVQWKPRRVASENGPKTITAIRQEAANVSLHSSVVICGMGSLFGQ